MYTQSTPLTILFFGSTTDSVIVLEKLVNIKRARVAAVVTQPPRPVGRDQTVTPTPVEAWAKGHGMTSSPHCRNQSSLDSGNVYTPISIFSFPTNEQKPWLYQDEQQVIDALQPIQADLVISASYGIKIPWETIQNAAYGGINIHPSILPHWRGADPVPWAILSGDHQIGVTVVTLSESFDEGKILAQKKIPITPTDMSGPLRTRLFRIGADMLLDVLKQQSYRNAHVRISVGTKLPYARKFTREDGFEPWKTIVTAITEGKSADQIERKFRALHPWPGVWTKITINETYKNNKKIEKKRLKILKLHLDNGKLVLEKVQLEGKKPVSWKQYSSAYANST